MLDYVKLKVKAGDGGNGVVSFRREKFVPYGGPDGGDGGKGGDLIIKADAGINTLGAYQRKRSVKAENGGNGQGKKRHGKNGQDLVLGVPAGTVVFLKSEAGGNILLADLEEHGQQITVAKGGRGGWGNVHFASPTRQAPRIAQKGEPGEEKVIMLELRLIADVGIIGYPNVGKSSLLAAVSAAKPKIADYAFTTLEPVLGVVVVGDHSFVMAEIPGLIEGAGTGKGLGHDFLRHAMRTRMFLHLLDGSSASLVENLVKVNCELGLFDPALAQKPQLVAVNKIDLPEVRDRVNEIKSAFTDQGISPVFVSAATGAGIGELVTKTWKMLLSLPPARKQAVVSGKVFRPRPVDVKPDAPESPGETGR